MIYNSLILPHFNCSLLAWGCNCQNIEILQKKAIAHTEPILKAMNQLKLSDMYTCHLLNPGTHYGTYMSHVFFLHLLH